MSSTSDWMPVQAMGIVVGRRKATYLLYFSSVFGSLISDLEQLAFGHFVIVKRCRGSKGRGTKSVVVLKMTISYILLSILDMFILQSQHTHHKGLLLNNESNNIVIVVENVEIHTKGSCRYVNGHWLKATMFRNTWSVHVRYKFNSSIYNYLFTQDHEKMLYLVGLGLADEHDITVKGLEVVKRAARVYLEAYTAVLLVDHKRLVGSAASGESVLANVTSVGSLLWPRSHCRRP